MIFQEAMAFPVAKMTIKAMKKNKATRERYTVITTLVGNEPILVEI